MAKKNTHLLNNELARTVNEWNDMHLRIYTLKHKQCLNSYTPQDIVLEEKKCHNQVWMVTRLLLKFALSHTALVYILIACFHLQMKFIMKNRFLKPHNEWWKPSTVRVYQNSWD